MSRVFMYEPLEDIAPDIAAAFDRARRRIWGRSTPPPRTPPPTEIPTTPTTRDARRML